MTETELRHKPGLYRISNLVNGKQYIGLTGNVGARWNSHRFDLKHGKHGNPHLQAAWNQYGESAFEFSILAICEKHMLGGLEKRAILTFNTMSPRGYNLTRGGEAPVFSQESRTRMSVSRRGKPTWSKGLTAATDERIRRSCEKGAITKTGKKQSESTIFKRAVDYTLVAPDGKIHSGRNVNRFCRANGLNSGAIFLLLRGRKPQYRGWTNPSFPRRPPKTPKLRAITRPLTEAQTKSIEARCRTYCLLSPDCKIVEIKGLKRFCRENGLNDGAMYQVALGRYKFKSYKGWRRA